MRFEIWPTAMVWNVAAARAIVTLAVCLLAAVAAAPE
jgi:hypothetical protein